MEGREKMMVWVGTSSSDRAAGLTTCRRRQMKKKSTVPAQLATFKVSKEGKERRERGNEKDATTQIASRP